MYREYFSPAKGVLDGDLCELFLTLGQKEKARLCGLLGVDLKVVSKLLTKMQAKFS